MPKQPKTHILYNHMTCSLSELDLMMVKSVPSGGNWKDIPLSIPSRRLEQIRKSGGRTTYYGRLRWDKPSYTVTTYFNRPGNGCSIHPDDNSAKVPQHRLISFREAARLQSFPDSFRFIGTKTSLYKQIGNAVPPLLAYALARQFPGETAVDLFCGAGGLSHGFEMAGFSILAGLDSDKYSMETWKQNHAGAPIHGDISREAVKDALYKEVARKLKGKRLDLIIGGPPCQGFSTAGWRNSVDPRNQLWNHYFEVVSQLKPRHFLIENVPGLLSATQQGAQVIGLIQEAFQEIGYSISYKKLNSEDYGVPQLRRRIFIIGTSKRTKEVDFPMPVLECPLTVKDAIKNLPVLGVNDGADVTELRRFNASSMYQEWLSGEIRIEKIIGSYKHKRAA